jgi:hypothetical protein
MRHLPILAGLFRNEVVWCSQVPFYHAGGTTNKKTSIIASANPEVRHNSSLIEAFPGFSMFLWYEDSKRVSSNRDNREIYFHLCAVLYMRIQPKNSRYGFGLKRVFGA